MSVVSVFKCDNCGKYPIEPINPHSDRHYCHRKECRKAAESMKKLMATIWTQQKKEQV